VMAAGAHAVTLAGQGIAPAGWNRQRCCLLNRRGFRYGNVVAYSTVGGFDTATLLPTQPPMRLSSRRSRARRAECRRSPWCEKSSCARVR
jgi:hypothetical protein